MATGALAKLIEADWGDAELLLVDLPPGTGDVQLSLIQQLAAGRRGDRLDPAGPVADRRRAARSTCSTRRSVPVLGIIENMAGYACPHCGEASRPVRERRRRSRGGRAGRAVPRPAAAVAEHPRGLRCRHAAGRRRRPGSRGLRRARRANCSSAGDSRRTEALSRRRAAMPLTRDEDIAELLAKRARSPWSARRTGPTARPTA